LSDSDRPAELPWPPIERRQTVRRKGAIRRAGPSVNPAGEDRRRGDRRSGVDRRDETAWQVVPLDPALPAPSDDGRGLIAAATAARLYAHAHYSHFQVGAALETVERDVITGCNIENATYGLTLCAERVALVKALSEGHAVFTRIAVVADTDDLTPPCGPCRQLLWEYCGDVEVVLANLKGVEARFRLSELLPFPFDGRFLG
jgi:cytidine deaminase